MRMHYEQMNKADVYVWGNGKILRRYLNQFPIDLHITSIIDSNTNKYGPLDFSINGRQMNCIPPDVITCDSSVIIAVENPREVDTIGNLLDRKDIQWCHIFEMTDTYFQNVSRPSPEIIAVSPNEDKIILFLDTVVPVTACNLQCNYCYLAQNQTCLDHSGAIYHSPAYIRYCLSRQRMGGTVFINFCGVGETLLCRELIPIAAALMEEGHYVQIVTNATVTGAINQIVNSGINLSHLFLKCSFHYRQLKEKNLLTRFSENIAKLMDAGVSISIEITPEDELVPMIDEIKEYSLEHFGALPHISVARDEGYDDFRIYSKFSRSEYKEIWKQFESPMFSFKMQHMASQKGNRCMAGLWSGELNIATGDLQKCVGNTYICNIFENPEQKIPFEMVGTDCCMPYCFNNHVYLTFGLIPTIVTPTYLEMRDRITTDGRHWITDPIRNIFSQKLDINNCYREEPC